MGALKFTLQNDPEDRLRVSLAGVVDETTDLQELLDALEGKSVVLDLGGIERINSVGVQRWTRAMTEMTRRQPVRIENCPYPMSFQANVVSNFFGEAEVWSCLAPYFCPSCNQEVTVEVTVEDAKAASESSPKKECPDCGGATEFDELDGFFQFMKEARVLD